MIPEQELTTESLYKEIDQIMGDSAVQKEMSDNSKKIGVPDASDRLIKVLTDLVNK